MIARTSGVSRTRRFLHRRCLFVGFTIEGVFGPYQVLSSPVMVDIHVTSLIGWFAHSMIGGLRVTLSVTGTSIGNHTHLILYPGFSAANLAALVMR
jgi:hypothetical protein